MPTDKRLQFFGNMLHFHQVFVRLGWLQCKPTDHRQIGKLLAKEDRRPKQRDHDQSKLTHPLGCPLPLIIIGWNDKRLASK